MTDAFQSSDDNRTASPLAYAKYVTFDQPLPLELGATLPEVTVCFETYGELNADKSNAVLVTHALSGDSHVAKHNDDDQPGWWDGMVGPGKPVDTDRFFVICSNVLGGCRGTTGPESICTETGRPYGSDFPAVTLADMVAVQARLMDHFGIERLHAVVGGSLGGHQALTWATRYPGRVANCCAIATSPRLSSQALAFDVVGRNAIQSDPSYHGGQYYDQADQPDAGLAIARMLGHITYLSPEAMNAKFDTDRHNPRDIQTAFEKKFSVGSYLAYQGHRFVERFDANSYCTISMAMDLFDLGRSAEELAASLAPSQCDWLVVSFSSDWLFTPAQSCEIVDALVKQGKPVTYCEVPSEGGHDAFLLPDELSRYGKLVRAKLCTAGQDGRTGDKPDSPNNLFHSRRLDYDLMLGLVEPGASVLDVGCGRGGLLARLRDLRECTDIMGVEVNEPLIITSVERGLNVIDHDLNRGLPQFTDGQFDYVVLSQTLQAVHNTEHVIEELVRVGKRAIVAFPNFAYHKLRAMLSEEGRSPKAPGEFDYEWYNTPNRRFPSIADFEDLCRHKNIRIEQARFLDTDTGQEIPADEDPNLNASTAILVLTR